MKAAVAESGRAKCLAATALSPAVRRPVTQLPSISARGSPVSLSNSVIKAPMVGSPRAALSGQWPSALMAANGGSSAAASIAMNSRLPGVRAHFGAFHTVPAARPRSRCSIASTTSTALTLKPSSALRGR